MSEETGSQGGAPAEQPTVDPLRLELARQRLASEQKLGAGIGAGAVAALAGAALWAVITVFTGYQIGFMAVGIGFLVGWAVRAAGKGVDKSFGIAGAVLALLGCLVGNLLAMVGFVARQEGIPFFDLLSRLDVSVAIELMKASFSPIDLLFYGIAVYEGYRLSFRRLTAEEAKELLGSG
jgi:hypothetical protein